MRDDLAERLLCVLRGITGVSDLMYREAPERLTGGFWAELLAFSLDHAPPGWRGQLVARVMPDAQTAAKETVVQAAMADAGVPTPTVRASGGPDNGLGRAFMVMDRAEGVPLLAGIERVSGLLGAPRRLWRMPDVLASVMAQLHATDPAPTRQRLAQLDGVRATLADQLDWLRAWAQQSNRADLAAAAQWLLDHRGTDANEVVCHGDLHPFNVLVDHDRNVTVLDWSVALLAPRAYDVAFTSLLLANPPIAVPGPAQGAVRAVGRGLAARFVRRYEHHSGTHIDATTLPRYQAMVALRALVEVARWVHEDVVDARTGHPWLLCGDAFAGKVTAVTGVPVRPR
jgi:aminoglycoside phosphotransferase (APT) family kinase protein